MNVLIMAKEPVPGRVKTRLCPPCTPEEAAAVAEAALADTLAAVQGCGAERRVVALAGSTGAWLPPGFDVIEQRGDGFAQRLEAAWAEVGGPVFQIGMDTPQLTAADLDAALAAVEAAGPGGAALGPAADGGWWGLGLARPCPGLFAGVPMSTSGTGDAQRRRLADLHREVVELAEHRDIDTVDDLVEVAARMPSGRTPSLVRRLGLGAAAR